jgi:xylan 1,4-beta-xylosidase
MLRSLCLLALCAVAFPCRAEPTYQNPVLTADNPADPHVIRIDDAYYLYATTHGRGYDVFVSRNLVHWENKGSVFDDPRGGAWAPDVFHDPTDGKFYLYYTDSVDVERSRGASTDHLRAKQVGVAVADSPLGPFVDKKVLFAGSIDGHMFRDDDGQYYLFYVEIADGFRIMLQPMDDPLTPRGEPIEIMRPDTPWETAAGEVTEGPWMIKRNGLYYLMYSGSGADTPNYAVGYATASNPLGPYKKYAGNPIAKGDGERIFGPGHHSVVNGPDGKLWMVYHQKYSPRVSYRRFIAIDPMWFDDAGVIHARVSRDEPQPAPLPAGER